MEETMSGHTQHPHLFFTADKLPALREKTQHPRFRRDWEALLAQATKCVEDPLTGDSRLAYAARSAALCAFVHAIGGEQRFAARAREFMDAILREKNWAQPIQIAGKVKFWLDTAHLCHHFAFAYDLMAAEMPPAGRKRIVEACQRELIGVFLNECKSPDNPYLYGLRTMNIEVVTASAAGCLLLALHRDGDGVDYSREIEIARAHVLRFVDWLDDAGASLETGGYWGYGMGHAVRFLAAARMNGWPQIFQQRSRKLARTAYPNLCMSIGCKWVTNFSDGNYGESDGPVRILAAEFKDSTLQWFADQMPPGDELAFICGDPDLPATPPIDLPTCIVYHGCGVGVLRASMTDPQTLLLGLKAGRARGQIYDDPHCQFDLNSVVLEAYGTTLLADPGYGHVWDGSMSATDPHHISNSTPPHNSLLVGGAGQIHTDNPLAHLQDLSPSDDIDYIASRLERGYGPHVLRFDRHAYFIAKKLFVLIDDIELTEAQQLTWNFHGKKNAAIGIGGGDGRIACDGVELRIAPFGPARLQIKTATDHLLPRVQYDTSEPAKSLRVGWLLPVHRQGEDAPTNIAAEFTPEGAQVTFEGRTWRLPVIVRRASFRSDIMLPYPRV